MLPIAQALETAISGLYYGEHFNIWERLIRCGLVSPERGKVF